MRELKKGRPMQPGLEDLLCPRCDEPELIRSGFHIYRTAKEEVKNRKYLCRKCGYQTTRPIERKSN